MRLQKALYGCLKSALLFYEKLTGDLESHGSERNPYYLCVMNKRVDGKQLNFTWHVDDLKISHVDKKFVSSTILWLESVYGKIHGTRGN